MLVLARRPGERIVLAKDIIVTVVAVQGGTVRLGIEAPREVSVLRSELITAGQAQAQALAGRKA
jgi:carbon storage regulator